MKIRYAKVRVRLSETHTRPALVPEWEAPLLQAIHGENAVLTGEYVESEKKRVPDAADEFQRLADRYKTPENGETPYVAMVYGAFGPGIARLQEAIDSAVIEEKAPKARKKAPAKKQTEDNLESLLNEDGE